MGVSEKPKTENPRFVTDLQNAWFFSTREEATMYKAYMAHSIGIEGLSVEQKLLDEIVRFCIKLTGYEEIHYLANRDACNDTVG